LEVIVSPIEALKAEATAPRLAEKALGRSMKHSEALEQVAKKHGYENRRVCSALLNAQTPEEASEPADKLEGGEVNLKRYISPELNFALDIPERRNRFPPVSTNSPFEVIRFLSCEDGIHGLIVFRWPCDPQQPISFYSGRSK
jgi:hypothetical protein